MSDLDPSVADIAQARNQKLQHEAEVRGQQMQLEVEADTAQEVTGELLSAHLAAQHIKDILPQPIETTQVCAAAAAPLLGGSGWQQEAVMCIPACIQACMHA
jgi:hypothetical protein